MLCGGERIVFLTLFWALMFVIVSIKAIMDVFTLGIVFDSPAYSQAVGNQLHLGYYLDLGIWVGAGWAMITYPPLRLAELKMFNR
jgi:hypothetical protein